MLPLVQSEQVSVLNGKDIIFRLIDGEKESAAQIANRLGYIGEALTDAQLHEAVDLIF